MAVSKINKDIKVYFGTTTIATTTSSTDYDKVVPAVSGAKEYLSIIPYGWSPWNSWNPTVIFKETTLSERKIRIHVKSPANDTLNINYYVIYR